MKYEARKSPEFLDRAIIYQLFLRAFTPEGTIKAAEKLLPHLADMGVDIIYLCPITQADDDMRPEYWSERQKASGLGNPRSPYRLKDYFAIDEEYGSDNDLRSFVRKAHLLNMKVMLDLVYLHCGPQATFMDENPDFVQRTAAGEVVYGQWHFPLINFASRQLREYLWRNMAYFVQEFDIDGYRCDVGDGCPLDFWETARQRLEAINPDIVMLNEGTNPDYLVTAFDLNYDFGWAAVLLKAFKNEAPANAVTDYWNESKARRPQGGRCIRALDNHDIANDSYETRIEAAIGPRAVEAALLVNYTLDGVPFLYNGYEVADSTRHSIFANRLHGRNMTINWANALAAAGSDRMAFVRRLSGLRHTQAALAKGDVQWLDHDAPDAVLAFTRHCDRQSLLIVVNTSRMPLTVNIAAASDHEPTRMILSRGAEGDFGPAAWIVDLLPFGCLIAEY